MCFLFQILEAAHYIWLLLPLKASNIELSSHAEIALVLSSLLISPSESDFFCLHLPLIRTFVIILGPLG